MPILLQVVPSDVLSLLTADELMSILGSAEITDAQLEPWFDCWQVVDEAKPQAELLRTWLKHQTPKRRAEVLQFYTGSSGLAMPLTTHSISRQHDTTKVISPTESNKLEHPVILATAGTCGALFRLPEWRDAEELCVGMETTLTWGSGFGLG